MYDNQLYEAYGYSLDEGDEEVRKLQRAYETAPTLQGLFALNVARARSGRDVPVFDKAYGVMMQQGIVGLLRSKTTSRAGGNNFNTTSGEYSRKKIPVAVVLHESDKPHQVLRISFGAHRQSILFDVHQSDGNKVYFSGRPIPGNRAVVSWRYISSPKKITNPAPDSEWLYSPSGLLKWLSKELDAFKRAGNVTWS